MPQNTLLIRARKSAGFTTQRDLGRAVFSKLPMPAKDAYAQKKVSLWESGQAKPATEEIRVLAELLGLGFAELEDSFAAVLPLSAADTISALAKSGNPCLIASYFGGKTRDTTLAEMQDAFREALNGNVSVAIFFPYPLDVSVRDRSVHVRGLVGAYIDIWRSIVRYKDHLSSLAESVDAAQRVVLYRPKLTQAVPANILLPPMFRRHTVIYEAVPQQVVKRTYYVWSESAETQMDGLFRAGIRNVEPVEYQIDMWEQYFGEVIDEWLNGRQLPKDDPYWTAYESKASGQR